MDKKNPVFDEKKPYVAVRDRKTNAAYHQGDSLFDRKKQYLAPAEFTLQIKAPPPPVVKTRDIAERRIGRNNRTIIGKLADKLIGKGAEDPEKPANSAPPKGTGVRRTSKPIGKPAGVDQVLQKASAENRQAAAAESLAA